MPLPVYAHAYISKCHYAYRTPDAGYVYNVGKCKHLIMYEHALVTYFVHTLVALASTHTIGTRTLYIVYAKGM